MDIFLNNFYFIWLNSFLALISVLFGWLMSKAHSAFAKVWTGFIWLLFLPNTFYILTDITHLFEDWPKVNNLFRFILIIQYGLFSIFGIITFIIATYFFEKLINQTNKKRRNFFTIFSILILNFVVGFGTVLGGIQRTHSLYIFTDPLRVISDMQKMFSSSELLMISIGFGLLANCIYFLLVNAVAVRHKKFSK